MTIPPRCCACITVLLVLCAVGTNLAQAQAAPVSPTRSRYWLNLGAGAGRAGEGYFAGTALSGGLGLTYQPSLLLFSTRVVGIWNPVRGDILRDAAVLVGVGTRGQVSHASIAVGPALTSGNVGVFREDSTSFSSRIGAAIQVQVLSLPLEGIGLGITGFANLNSHQSFGGVMLSLGFGQLR